MIRNKLVIHTVKNGFVVDLANPTAGASVDEFTMVATSPEALAEIVRVWAWNELGGEPQRMVGEELNPQQMPKAAFPTDDEQEEEAVELKPDNRPVAYTPDEEDVDGLLAADPIVRRPKRAFDRFQKL